LGRRLPAVDRGLTLPMDVVTCIEDMRRIARRRLPRMFYDYVDAGSWTESSYRANREDLAALRLRQRVLVDIQNRSLASKMLGEQVAMPVGLAPTGLTGMLHADGEILAAQAAEQIGVPFTLSTMSICSIEDVASHTRKPFWFQLYMMRDRVFMERLIERANAAHCSALVLTVDLQVMGQRHKDLKNGLSAPPRPTMRNWLNLASKPVWCWHMLNTHRRSFGNIVGHASGVNDAASLADWNARQFDPTLNWKDIGWIKKRWKGKLVLKGILDVADARQALDAGVDAIVVSNHGGRQLDGARSSIVALPAIADAVGHHLEVHMDGGINSGQDVLKALALGARGVYVGRAFLYGLAAYGRQGVVDSLSIIRKELDTTMALCGLTDIHAADRSTIFHGGEPALH